MRRLILRWFVQAAIVGIGLEAGKDIYKWVKGKKQRDEAAPPVETPTAPEEPSPPSTSTSG